MRRSLLFKDISLGSYLEIGQKKPKNHCMLKLKLDSFSGK